MDRTAYKNRHIKEHYDRMERWKKIVQAIHDPDFAARRQREEM